MTRQDARSLQAGDKITDGRHTFHVVDLALPAPDKGDRAPYVWVRRPHTKTVMVHDVGRYQRAPESTRKGRRVK